MQLLFVHSDHLEFEVTTEAGEDLAETEGVPMEGRMEDCVTVFVSVEREDEVDPGAVVENAVAELRDVADQLNTRKVVLYPYTHLSDDLAAPDSAKSTLRNLQTELESDFEVLRAPFGWYKAFEMSCKGHPLSELSRHVTPERSGDDAPDSEGGMAERSPSEWRLLFPDGETRNPVDAKDDDRVSDDLRAFVEAEVEGETPNEDDRPSHGEQPPHVELAQEQELVGYDELGDVGTLRWYPRGTLVRDSLAEYVNDLAVEYGGMPVEESGGRQRFRPAASFGLMRDAQLSESDLPLRIYEASTDSFWWERRDEGKRRDDDEPRNENERREEVADLTRKRNSTTPEMYTATRDMERAKAELRAQARLSLRTSDALGLNYVPVVRLTREFYDGNEAWVESLVEDLGTPALLEILPERHHCWSVKIDLPTVDQLDRRIENSTVETSTVERSVVGNSTVELDVESAERFDVTYGTGGVDEGDEDDDEKTPHPPILHCSPSGSIERVLAALLERAAQLEPPRLPTWLSPTQVRFIPVSEEQTDYCDALAEDLESEGIRADVDEREESVGTRIATAETDWVPYYAVVGNRELEGEDDDLKVNVRAGDEEREMDFETLQATVLDDVGDLPKKRRYFPKRVSKHPNFTGR